VTQTRQHSKIDYWFNFARGFVLCFAIDSAIRAESLLMISLNLALAVVLIVVTITRAGKEKR
jgi:hypothetical protein